MVASIKVKEFYDYFKEKCKDGLITANDILEGYDTEKEELIKYLEENKDRLLKTYNIDLDNYQIEWGEKRYNDNLSLYNIVKLRLEDVKDNSEDRECLIQVVKYVNLLSKFNTIENSFETGKKLLKITAPEYRSYVDLFYRTVEKFILAGKGYRFNYGIGIYLINYWVKDKGSAGRKFVDYKKTQEYKKYLISQGKKPYDVKEAEEYYKRGEEYDGVPYTVYRELNTIYEIAIIKSAICGSTYLKLVPSQYINDKYKGWTTEQVAETLNSIEDIYDLPMSTKNKIRIMTHRFPEVYVNFIRNADKKKYRVRAGHSKD